MLQTALFAVRAAKAALAAGAAAALESARRTWGRLRVLLPAASLLLLALLPSLAMVLASFKRWPFSPAARVCIISLHFSQSPPAPRAPEERGGATRSKGWGARVSRAGKRISTGIPNQLSQRNFFRVQYCGVALFTSV